MCPELIREIQRFIQQQLVAALLHSQTYNPGQEYFLAFLVRHPCNLKFLQYRNASILYKLFYQLSYLPIVGHRS